VREKTKKRRNEILRKQNINSKRTRCKTPPCNERDQRLRASVVGTMAFQTCVFKPQLRGAPPRVAHGWGRDEAAAPRQGG